MLVISTPPVPAKEIGASVASGTPGTPVRLILPAGKTFSSPLTLILSVRFLGVVAVITAYAAAGIHILLCYIH